MVICHTFLFVALSYFQKLERVGRHIFFPLCKCLSIKLFSLQRILILLVQSYCLSYKNGCSILTDRYDESIRFPFFVIWPRNPTKGPTQLFVTHSFTRDACSTALFHLLKILVGAEVAKFIQ